MYLVDNERHMFFVNLFRKVTCKRLVKEMLHGGCGFQGLLPVGPIAYIVIPYCYLHHFYIFPCPGSSISINPFGFVPASFSVPQLELQTCKCSLTRMGLEREDFNSVRVALLSMKAILACVPVVMLPFALKPSAELFVVGWGCVSAWFRPPFLYVVLNVVIVTLGVKSGALTTSSTSDQPEVSGDAQMDNSTDLYIRKGVDGSDSDRCATPEQDGVAVEEEVAVSKPDEKCGETQLVCGNLINEVDAGQITSFDSNEEKEKEEEEMLSAEELYEKSKMFIGNFYRELKLQQIE